MIIEARLVHPSNALAPIEVTLVFGIVTDVRLVQPLNASPIEVTLFGIVTEAEDWLSECTYSTSNSMIVLLLCNRRRRRRRKIKMKKDEIQPTGEALI